MNDYQALNSEIRVPQEWPVEIARSAFIDVAEFAISHYLPEKKIILRVGKVPTVVIRSETGWKYLFKKIEGTGDEDASILINLILPEEVTLLHSNNNDENRSGERRIECLPMILKSNIFDPKMFSSSSKYCKVLVPDTKKIFEREGITGPDADGVSLMVKYKLWLPKMILSNIDEAEGAPSTSAASTTSSEMDFFEDWDVIYLDSLRKSPRQRYNWPMIRFNCFIYFFIFVIFVITFFAFFYLFKFVLM